MIAARLPSRHSLSRFIVISILLHLFLMVSFRHSSPTITNRTLGQIVLDVQLQGDLNSPASSPASIPAARLLSVTNDNAQATVPTEKTAGASPAPPVTTTRAPTPSSAVSTGLRNQLLGEIRTRLSQYLTYPPLARERGWEGMVLLDLRIESDGRLEHIRVERGSGYAVLDHSALSSLNRLHRLSEASAWLNGRSVDLQLPITYRLVEN